VLYRYPHVPAHVIKVTRRADEVTTMEVGLPRLRQVVSGSIKNKPNFTYSLLRQKAEAKLKNQSILYPGKLLRVGKAPLISITNWVRGNIAFSYPRYYIKTIKSNDLIILACI